MVAYYNEIDPYAAEWLRNLIADGRIAPGDVDERSIEDVKPNELMGYTQCHFFAGIGVWSYALRLAGWPDNRPVWTGSCPCQPFSAAGQGAGFADERHLWPAFHHLIRECRPGVVIGEQVASRDGLTWLDLVHADMEAEGYAFGAVDLCAAGVGAPHIRQRLYFVANAYQQQRDWRWNARTAGWGEFADYGAARILEHPESNGREQWRAESGGRSITGGCCASGMADVSTRGRGSLWRGGCASPRNEGAHPDNDHEGHQPGPTNGRWADVDWLFCRDGKWRPVEPGTFPLAHGAPARVGRLRAYGNAINAEQAEAVIRAYLGCQLTGVSE